MKSFAWVKALSMAVVLAGSALLIAGCAQGPNSVNDTDWVPGYSTQENGDRILRDMHYNIEEFWDDVDTDVFQYRPSSQLTWWNVSQSN